LNADDHFQIVVFDATARTLYDEFQQVNSQTKADAVAKVRWDIEAAGSTNIDDAMNVAIQQRNGNDAANIIIFISDGEPTAGEKNWENIRNNTLGYNDG